MSAVGVNLSQMALCAIGPCKALKEACKVKIQQRSGARQRSSVDTSWLLLTLWNMSWSFLNMMNRSQRDMKASEKS